VLEAEDMTIAAPEEEAVAEEADFRSKAASTNEVTMGT
jgi:hypothetical protein